MRKTLRLLTGALAALVALVLFASTAQAAGTLSVTPSSGPGGTMITISGTGCVGANHFGGWSIFYGDTATPPEVGTGFVASDPVTGAWSDTFTFAGDATEGDYVVIASCVIDEFDPVGDFDYTNGSFLLTAPVTTTTEQPTTTTEQPTTTTQEPTTTTEAPTTTTDEPQVTTTSAQVGGNTVTPPPGGGIQTDGGLPQENDPWYIDHSLSLLLGSMVLLLFGSEVRSNRSQRLSDNQE